MISVRRHYYDPDRERTAVDPSFQSGQVQSGASGATTLVGSTGTGDTELGEPDIRGGREMQDFSEKTGF